MPPVSIDLGLLPDEDFRFRLGIVPANAEEYFALSPEADAVLTERRRWLHTAPELYAGLLPEGAPVAEEFLDYVETWPAFQDAVRQLKSSHADSLARLVELSCQMEPDLVLLAPHRNGPYTVAGGCVCFPSGWRLTDKIGRSMQAVHDPVPGINAAIGAQIDRLLPNMRSEHCVIRWNWGACRSPELNHHPDRLLPELVSPLNIDDVWLRREYQALLALPKTGGIVFGIHVSHVPWRALRDDRDTARRAAHAIRTMPADLLKYKRLDHVRDELLRLLGATAD